LYPIDIGEKNATVLLDVAKLLNSDRQNDDYRISALVSSFPRDLPSTAPIIKRDAN
jgi:hypothetical protein